jgi:hypothetical protein
VFVTPGSTHTRWFARSTSSTRFIRDVTIRTPSASGSAPPERPEPEPRATHGTPAAAQARTQAWTSSAVPGRTATPGRTAYCSRPSDSYVRSWCSAV